MRAIAWTNYGSPDVLRLKQFAKPVPKDNEVLIKIHATTVSRGDCELRNLQFPFFIAVPMRLYMGIFRPRRRILGQELAGEVEAVGLQVTRFKVGDPVFATTGLGMGSYAEYICLPEDPKDMQGYVLHKPANLSYEEAAVVPIGGLDALNFLRRADIQPGQKVLIVGGAGRIGGFALQIAKHFGAEVTGVDSAKKLDLMRSLGADHVIDYAREDFTKNGQTYDVIFDVPGVTDFSGSLQSITPGGYYLIANPGFADFMRAMRSSSSDGRKILISSTAPKPEDLHFLKELIEAGKLKVVIGRRYPLEHVADAHRFVETGRSTGAVVINVQGIA